MSNSDGLSSLVDWCLIDWFWSVKLKVALVRLCDMMMTLFFQVLVKKGGEVSKLVLHFKWQNLRSGVPFPWAFFLQCFPNYSKHRKQVSWTIPVVLPFGKAQANSTKVRSMSFFTSHSYGNTLSYYTLYNIYISIFWCFHCMSLWLWNSHLANHLMNIYPTTTPNDLTH